MESKRKDNIVDPDQLGSLSLLDPDWHLEHADRIRQVRNKLYLIVQIAMSAELSQTFYLGHRKTFYDFAKPVTNSKLTVSDFSTTNNNSWHDNITWKITLLCNEHTV
jgi:hypothetical protein